MAPLPVINDTFRCAFNWNVNNVCNVIHIHASGMDATDVAGLISDWVTKDMWKSNNSFNKIESVDITPLYADAATLRFTTDGSAKWGGDQTGQTVMNCAAVVSFKTLQRGAANRGRAYIGPCAEAVLEDSIINSSVRGTMVGAWATFGAALVTHDAQHVIASYKHGTALTVVGWSIRPAAGTMRRRQDRLAHT